MSTTTDTRVRRCPWCGHVGTTRTFAVVETGWLLPQHGEVRRRCPGCRREGRAWVFARVPLRAREQAS